MSNSVLSIDAKRRHHMAEAFIQSDIPEGIFSLAGIFFAAQMVAVMASYAIGDWSWWFLTPSALIVFSIAFLFIIEPIATKHRLTNKSQIAAVNRYKALLPENQAIAAPIVRRLCELSGGGSAVEQAKRERLSLLREIEFKDQQDRLDHSAKGAVDDSDVIMVRSALDGHAKAREITENVMLQVP